MNLITGEIVEIYMNGAGPLGKVRIRGALMNVILGLVPEARVGDKVLIDSGVAITTVSDEPKEAE